MSDPTIRISSCRGDGRCPECGYVGDGGYRFTGVAPCGCTVCVICEPVHLRALLTEALRKLDLETARLLYCDEKSDAAIAKLREEHDAAIARVEFQAAELRNRDEALARVVRERDAAIRRADRAEALLREIAAVPLVGLTLGSVLLAKIREALASK